MLDTSFLIRLMKEDDPLHKSAVDYFQYLLVGLGGEGMVSLIT